MVPQFLYMQLRTREIDSATSILYVISYYRTWVINKNKIYTFLAIWTSEGGHITVTADPVPLLNTDTRVITHVLLTVCRWTWTNATKYGFLKMDSSDQSQQINPCNTTPP